MEARRIRCRDTCWHILRDNSCLRDPDAPTLFWKKACFSGSIVSWYRKCAIQPEARCAPPSPKQFLPLVSTLERRSNTFNSPLLIPAETNSKRIESIGGWSVGNGTGMMICKRHMDGERVLKIRVYSLYVREANGVACFLRQRH